MLTLPHWNAPCKCVRPTCGMHSAAHLPALIDDGAAPQLPPSSHLQEELHSQSRPQVAPLLTRPHWDSVPNPERTKGTLPVLAFLGKWAADVKSDGLSRPVASSGRNRSVHRTRTRLAACSGVAGCRKTRAIRALARLKTSAALVRGDKRYATDPASKPLTTTKCKNDATFGSKMAEDAEASSAAARLPSHTCASPAAAAQSPIARHAQRQLRSTATLSAQRLRARAPERSSVGHPLSLNENAVNLTRADWARELKLQAELKLRLGRSQIAGRGLFAAESIQEGTLVEEYTGAVRPLRLVPARVIMSHSSVRGACANGNDNHDWHVCCSAP